MTSTYVCQQCGTLLYPGETHRCRPRQWRTESQRGAGETLEARWRIYVEAMRAMGREPKTFDEWLNS